MLIKHVLLVYKKNHEIGPGISNCWGNNCIPSFCIDICGCFLNWSIVKCIDSMFDWLINVFMQMNSHVWWPSPTPRFLWRKMGSWNLMISDSFSVFHLCLEWETVLDARWQQTYQVNPLFFGNVRMVRLLTLCACFYHSAC